MAARDERATDRATAVLEMALTVRGLSKAFQGQLALDRASLELKDGEVHALLGQNGSGKSTLIKILAGYHRPDPGAQAFLRGEPFELGSPAAASAGGIRFIHQDLALVGEMDTVDNLALGNRYSGLLAFGPAGTPSGAAAARTLWSATSTSARQLRELSAAQRSMLAIVRAVTGIPTPSRACSCSTSRRRRCPIERSGSCSISSGACAIVA